MMVLFYCNDGNLRNYLNKSEKYIDYNTKINRLKHLASGLLNIHNAGKVHKDLHSGNILYNGTFPFISDLGMCQPADNKQTVKEEGIYGVLPYMAPEVLRGHQYTKAADVYSFGIIMNEYLSEEIPFNNIPHDQYLTIKICKGFRPKISEYIPKLIADLIIRCWDAKAENRPTANELYQKLNNYENYYDVEWYTQMKEYNKISENKFKNRLREDKSENIQKHPQAIYTSRLLNFKNLPEPVNSSDLSSFQSNSGNHFNSLYHKILFYLTNYYLYLIYI
jgi:serine/threonine protein kinase